MDRHVNGGHVDRLIHDLLDGALAVDLGIRRGVREQDVMCVHPEARRASRSRQRQTSLERHVYGGHVDRLVHELLEGTEGQDRLQSSPIPSHRWSYHLETRSFPFEVLATLLGGELPSEMAVRSRLCILRLIGGS